MSDSGFLIGNLFPYLILTLGFTAIYKIIPDTPVSFYQALARGASCAFLFKAMIIFVLWIFYSARILLFYAKMGSRLSAEGCYLAGTCL